MPFYLELSVKLALLFFLIPTIYYFLRSAISGATYAVTSPEKVASIIEIIRSNRTASSHSKAVDLGSGDGRVVIALARAGFEAHGYESNPYLVWLSRWKIRKAGLQEKAFIHKRSYWNEHLSSYDVIVIFGVFTMMHRMKKKLQYELQPGAVIVSNYFQFPDWEAIQKKDNIYVYSILADAHSK